MKGKLIIIESGSDGSGKETQTQKLIDRLSSENKNVLKVSYPNYDSPACEPVKMYLNGSFGDKASDVNPYAASTFYAIDRFASYKTNWKSFYENGGIVICDRYTTSNMVHQASKLKESEKDNYLDWLYNLEFNLYELPKPDLVIFLDVPPSITKKLRDNRLNKFTGEESKDIHEKDENYMRETYNNSLYIANKYNWTIINCVENNELLSIDKIHNKIYDVVNSIL